MFQLFGIKPAICIHYYSIFLNTIEYSKCPNVLQLASENSSPLCTNFPDWLLGIALLKVLVSGAIVVPNLWVCITASGSSVALYIYFLYSLGRVSLNKSLNGRKYSKTSVRSLGLARNPTVRKAGDNSAFALYEHRKYVFGNSRSYPLLYIIWIRALQFRNSCRLKDWKTLLNFLRG